MQDQFFGQDPAGRLPLVCAADVKNRGGADSFSAEQKHTSKIREKRTAFSVEKIEKAVFKVEILTDFNILCVF
ncbi:MAG: hypothetical protein IJW50_10045, partial [Clostridia bacterium]|nr:hypothetical protein [Clostridia bacterium]